MPENVELTTTKGGNNISTVFADEGLAKGHVAQKYIGTMADQRDMQALGKEQVLRVRYLSTQGKAFSNGVLREISGSFQSLPLGVL